MGVCYVCGNSKAALACGLCVEDLCKKCAQFVGEDQFAYMTLKPEALAHSVYCGPCYDKTVVPAIEQYENRLRLAGQVSVFYKDQGKETRGYKRLEPPVAVPDCPDREETLMRLAFMAVERNFNGLIDVDLISTKVRNGTYQKQTWSGTAIPVNIKPTSR